MNAFGADRRALEALLQTAVPVAVSQGSLAAMYFTDRYFMSRLDGLHIAAAHGGALASYLCIALFVGLISYATVLVAHHFGTGRYAQCAKVTTQGLILCLALTPLIALFAWAVGGIFQPLGHAPEQVALERDYFFLLMVAATLSLPKTCIGAFFIGTDRTRQVMVIELLGTLLNAPLAYLLIFGKWGFPALGIAGAAIATIVATAFSLLLLLAAYLAPANRRTFHIGHSLRFDAAIAGPYLALGSSAGFERFLSISAFNLFLLLFQSYGVAESTAAAIVLGWDSVLRVPMLGLAVALSSLVARHAGAGDWQAVRRTVGAGAMLAIGYTAAVGATMLLWQEPMIRLFLADGTDHSAVMALARWMMLGVIGYLAADALAVLAAGVLRGLGDTRWILLVSGLVHWLMLGIQVVAIRWLGLPALLSFGVFVLMVVCLATLYVRRARRAVRTHRTSLQ
ncbi:MATE family multidrug resistance protein [Tahibacter aquaticus]|uniref:MATE family multidrug resistance protein n=1 Tax=Tahibacter aquaticus TaxID=520092 RepID=A0A4R6Z6W7_9GAMM|nr:MATE family efflux transporter [Tahibacter aquaticus]TDR47492.1 MATE family multidrug resistance protein [Tahibacter aquaticus]